MAFFIQHRLGATTSNPPPSAFRALLDELKEHPEDQEHCSVAVTHETEWSLGAYGGGYVVWENLEEGEPRHMRNVSDETILRLWEAVARGDLDAVEREHWIAGY